MDQVAWDDDSTHESNTEGAQRDSQGDQNHANETGILHRIILDVGIEALLFRQLRSSPIMRGGLLRMVLVPECIQLDVSTVRHCVKVCVCLVLPTAVFFTPHRLQDENDGVRNGEANMQEYQRLVGDLVVSASGRAFSCRAYLLQGIGNWLGILFKWVYIEPVLHSSIPTCYFRFC